MERQDLRKRIEQLGPWYQRISLEGIFTGKKRDVKRTWEIIESSFPIDYKSSRILDLGCNAGFYSIMAAKKGASVIGIEAGQQIFKQAIFLKDYFEDLWDIQLDITYIRKDISDVNFISLGKFDCIFALAILYHIGNLKFGRGTPKSLAERDRVTSLLTKITDKFIVRARQKKHKNPKYYNKVFKNLGFRPTKTVHEGRSGRSLILYERVNN